MTHLMKAFEFHLNSLLDLCKCILTTQKDEFNKIVKILIKESVIDKALDLLIEKTESSKKAYSFINTLFDICKDINLITLIQQEIFNYLMKKNRYAELCKNIREVFMNSIKKKHKLEDKNIVELLCYVKSLLKFIKGLYGVPLKREMNIEYEANTLSLMTSLGYLLISLTELDKELYLHSDVKVYFIFSIMKCFLMFLKL